ncbi:ABC transporter substrate-binding protein [Bacterioplanes sanyensis]|uniref:substrate-binding periplasmic protein n=1 Tax=Bacterioplanes sanyensis TaxID=1249553 RepID=UPI0016796FED|nr:transporter substrate-binding domain-containing protein [Bacterioplanes sanyensis]GGY57768.1 ABC transporter substrate-binding protein [Bacterioplanes sanyensis]
MIRTGLTLLLTSLVLLSHAQQRVAVGVYPFAPFVEMTGDEDQPFQGLTIDLLALLNNKQQKYRFEPVMISPKRRYQAFLSGDYDLLFYESKDWGWGNIDIDTSAVYQRGRELYVALADPEREQSFFDDLSRHRLIGILGYHYGLAGHNSDEDYLRKHYNMLLSWDHRRNFDLLFERRGDVLIVNQSYLDRYMSLYPERAKRLLLSEKSDQLYRHTVLVRPDNDPSVETMNALLEQITQDGSLARLLEQQGIRPQLVVPVTTPKQ